MLFVSAKSCAKLIDSSNTTNFACTDGWKYRSVCTFSCNKGYFITEDDRRTIVRSGSKDTKCDRGVGDGMEWTDNIPVCLSKHCFAIRWELRLFERSSYPFSFGVLKTQRPGVHYRRIYCSTRRHFPSPTFTFVAPIIGNARLNTSAAKLVY